MSGVALRMSVLRCRVYLKRWGRSLVSSERQRRLCAVTYGRAHHVRTQVTAYKRTGSERGGTCHRGDVYLIVGLMRKSSRVTGLVASFAVGWMLRISNNTEWHLEIRLLARRAGGVILTDQHSGTWLVQTHRLDKPSLRLHKKQREKGCSACEKLSYNLNFYCISYLLFCQSASNSIGLEQSGLSYRRLKRTNLKSCSYFSIIDEIIPSS